MKINNNRAICVKIKDEKYEEKIRRKTIFIANIFYSRRRYHLRKARYKNIID